MKPARQQDILDKILGGVEEKQWGPAVVRQLRDEVRFIFNFLKGLVWVWGCWVDGRSCGCRSKWVG